MIRQPFTSLLKSTARSVSRCAHESLFYTVSRALSTSSSSSPKPPIKDDDAPKSPEPSVTPTSAAAEISQPKPAYITLYHHRDPSLFPQLIPGSLPYIMHNLSSAFNALVALFSSQEARGKFMSIADFNEKKSESTDETLYGSIINTNVLGQSDMGFIKVLALFDGLNSPLYEGTAFNVKDFMDGASYAIDRFHEVGREHMNMLTEKMEAAGETKLEYDFLEVAKSNPDSLERDLIDMTTPVYWKGFNQTMSELVEAPTFLLDILKKGSPPTSKITHLALLSARVASIEKPMSTKQNKDDEDPDAPLEDDTLKPHVERADSKPQIVTQLEVLYESEVTLTEIVQEGNNREDGVRSKMVVDVATFEACLAGDPNDNEVHDLMEMTTPMYWFAFNKITCQQLEAPTFLLKILKKGSFPTQKITHLALLSARVASIEKPILAKQNKDDEDLDAPLKDDTLKPHVERADSKPQIVTQLEVLYESEVTWKETDQEGNKREDSARSKVIVNVATFEACLAGDPNGKMQWRLCDTRLALEFGYGVKEEAMKKHCLNKK